MNQPTTEELLRRIAALEAQVRMLAEQVAVQRQRTMVIGPAPGLHEPMVVPFQAVPSPIPPSINPYETTCEASSAEAVAMTSEMAEKIRIALDPLHTHAASQLGG